MHVLMCPPHVIDALLLLLALHAAASSTAHQGGLSAVDLALGSRPVNRHLVDLLLDFDAAAAYGILVIATVTPGLVRSRAGTDPFVLPTMAMDESPAASQYDGMILSRYDGRRPSHDNRLGLGRSGRQEHQCHKKQTHRESFRYRHRSSRQPCRPSASLLFLRLGYSPPAYLRRSHKSVSPPAIPGLGIEGVYHFDERLT
jgi:hypothetical protein